MLCVRPKTVTGAHYSELRSVANGGLVESDLGHDIRFELDDAKLDHDIERYGPATGELIAWVRIPGWLTSQEPNAFLYFGKAGLGATEEDAAGTWAPFLAVWQLPGNTDRTGNGRGLTLSSVGAGTLIGDAGIFDGSTSRAVIPGASLSWMDGHSAFCLDYVTRHDATMVASDRHIIDNGTHGTEEIDHGLLIRHDDAGGNQTPSGDDMIFWVLGMADGTQARWESGSGLHVSGQDQVWHASWSSGSQPDLTRDGVVLTPAWWGRRNTDNTVTESATIASTTQLLAADDFSIGIGSDLPAYAYSGVIDCVRVRSSVPSALQRQIEAEQILSPWLVYGSGNVETPELSQFAPVAFDVETTVDQDSSNNAITGDALDPEGDSLSVTSVGSAANGTPATDTGMGMLYTPDANFSGDDEFTYTVSDGAATHQARVRVSVTAGAVESELPTPLDTINVSNQSSSIRR